jgi:hypothetical protein
METGEKARQKESSTILRPVKSVVNYIKNMFLCFFYI